MIPGHRADRSAWLMLALLCLGYGSFGLVSASLAPLITPILADTGMTRGEMGIVLGSWQFAYLFVAIPAGAIMDRFGLRRALFAGIALVGLSEILRAAAIDQITMLGAVMVFGLGGPFISIGAPKLVATWFSERQMGLALGLYTVSPSIGNMIALASANSVIMPATGDSWRLTLLAFAVVPAIAATAWFVFARTPGEGRHEEETEGGRPAMGSFRDVARVPLVRVILLMATGSFLFNHSFTNWLPEILRGGGMDASAAGFWAALPTLVAIGAALVIPRATSERWLTQVQVLVFLLLAGGALLIAFGAGLPLYLGLVLLGLGRGASTPLLMLTLMRSREIGPRLMGAAGGLFFTAGELGGVVGPSLTGVLAERTGGFDAGIVVLAAVSVALAGLAVVLRGVRAVGDSRVGSS